MKTASMKICLSQVVNNDKCPDCGKDRANAVIVVNEIVAYHCNQCGRVWRELKTVKEVELSGALIKPLAFVKR